MKGILSNYISERKKSRAGRLRTLVALFLLSAVVASSVVWCLRLVGTTMTGVPVYETAQQRANREAAGQSAGVSPLAPTASALPSANAGNVGALAADENLALHLSYTTTGVGDQHPDDGLRLTDGVTDVDSNNANDRCVGFYTHPATFEIVLGSASITKICVHYYVLENWGIGKLSKIDCFINDSASADKTVNPEEGTDGKHEIDLTISKSDAQKVKLQFSFERSWGYVSEIEIMGTKNPLHNLALNLQYKVEGVDYTEGYARPDMGQLTDGVEGSAATDNGTQHKDGTYTGFKSQLLQGYVESNGTTYGPFDDENTEKNYYTFEVTLESASSLISQIRLEYLEWQSDAEGCPERVRVYVDDDLKATGTCNPASSTGRVHGVMTINLPLNITGQKVRLHITPSHNSFRYYWIFLSEVKVLSYSYDDTNPEFQVQYYGHTDEITTSASEATGVENIMYHSFYTYSVGGDPPWHYNKPSINGPSLNNTGAWADDYRHSRSGSEVFDLNDGVYETNVTNPEAEGTGWVGFVTYTGDQYAYISVGAHGRKITGYYLQFLVHTAYRGTDHSLEGIMEPSICIYPNNPAGSVTNNWHYGKNVWLTENLSDDPNEVLRIGASYLFYDTPIECTNDCVSIEIRDKDSRQNQLIVISEIAIFAQIPGTQINTKTNTAKVIKAIDTRRDSPLNYYSEPSSGYFNQHKPHGKMPDNKPDSDNDADSKSATVDIPLVGKEAGSSWGVPATKRRLTKLYRDNYYHLARAPGVKYVNILAKNDDWILTEIWLGAPGTSAASVNAGDWSVTKYDFGSGHARPKEFDLSEFKISTTAGTDNTTIVVQEGSIVRLVFEPKPAGYTHDTPDFWDYDITYGLSYDGSNYYYPTYNYGINSFLNWWTGDYYGSEYWKIPTDGLPGGHRHGKPWGMIQHNADYPTTAYYAFGNQNVNTLYSFVCTDRPPDCTISGNNYFYKWKDPDGYGDNTLNRFNNNNNSDNGCTFKLVKSQLADYENNTLEWNTGIEAAPIWEKSTDVDQWGLNQGTYYTETHEGEEPVLKAARRYFDDMRLNFSKMGDSYVFNSVGSADQYEEYSWNLERITRNNNKSDGSGSETWSNNFWPFDNRTGVGGAPYNGVQYAATDPMFGGSNVGGDYRTAIYNGKGIFTDWYDLPASDDYGVDHNSFYGMRFDMDFFLTEDYVGPMEYFFYGDDDMWVYLDGALVCDIGGVHTSVGSYVNLWDTLSPYSVGQHKLTVYYTERGASGSSCYIRFNIPGISEMPNPANVGSLLVEKETDASVLPEVEFEFEIKLFQPNGSPDTNGATAYIYKNYENYYGSSHQMALQRTESLAPGGGKIKLKNREYVVVRNLPVGYKYTVQEISHLGYAVSAFADRVSQESAPNSVPTEPAALNSDCIYNGDSNDVIIAAKSMSRVHFRNKTGPELPSTGGVGREVLPVVGLTAVIFSSLAPVVLRDKSNRKQRRAK